MPYCSCNATISETSPDIQDTFELFTASPVSGMSALLPAAGPLKLDRPLVAFDIESTGLNVSKDRILELAAVKVWPDGKVSSSRSSSSCVRGLQDCQASNNLDCMCLVEPHGCYSSRAGSHSSSSGTNATMITRISSNSSGALAVGKTALNSSPEAATAAAAAAAATAAVVLMAIAHLLHVKALTAGACRIAAFALPGFVF